MDLKLGIVETAWRRGLFLRLSQADGHPHCLAQVSASATAPGEFVLVYPDGREGILKRGMSHQFILSSVSEKPEGYKPTPEQVLALSDTLPKDLIIFGGEYTVEVKGPSGGAPPPKSFLDEERFRNPVGVWNTTVAMLLAKGPGLIRD